MTLAAFLVEVRIRAKGLPTPSTTEHAIATLMGFALLPGPQAECVRRVLIALTRTEMRIDLSFRELASLGPLALGSLECVLEGIGAGHFDHKKLQAILGLSHG